MEQIGLLTTMPVQNTINNLIKVSNFTFVSIQLPIQCRQNYSGSCFFFNENKVSVISELVLLLSGVPDYFGRNKISSGGDLSHYSSASLY